MALDRDELAARFFAVILTPLVGDDPADEWDMGTMAGAAVEAADALIARLAQSNIDRLGFDPYAPVTPAEEAAHDEQLERLKMAAKIGKAKREAAATVAPVADAAPTDPRRTVGAVVRWDGQQDPDEEWLLVGNKKAVALKVRRPYLLDCGTNLDGGGDYFVRWATREECERHGIPYVERGAAPSPAAGLDAPAFDEASERETAVDIAKDRGLDVAEEVGFVAGWLARARIAAKGGAS